jgi:hypothetical protein
MNLAKHSHAILTGLCALALGLSFVPGLEWLAFASVALGAPYPLRAAWRAIRERRVGVDLLMVVAAAGAVAVGQARDAGALLFLFSLAETLEDLTLSRTRSAIEGLVRLRPDMAVRVGPESEEAVRVEALEPGDRVRVPPFEGIPADGVVVEGRSSVDAAAMTGESIPVTKGTGRLVTCRNAELGGVAPHAGHRPHRGQHAAEDRGSRARGAGQQGERGKDRRLVRRALHGLRPPRLGGARSECASPSEWEVRKRCTHP